MGWGGERIRALSLLAVVAVLVLSACKPLRDYPAAKTMFLGTAARANLLPDPLYSAVLAREFNGLVPENELKWEVLHPQPATYNFGPADALVDFARDHEMAVRGVPLLWHGQNPAWLTQGNFSRAQIRAIVKDHIARVVGRYRGRIQQWDVVNEPFLGDGSLRETVFTRIGNRYMDVAFAAARAADPAAKLFLNVNDLEMPGPKADAVFAYVSAMKARGVPIDGVGFEMHLHPVKPTRQQVAAQMARYAAIGLEVAVTEMDVRLTVPASTEALQAQAIAFGDALAVCRAAPNCKTFVLWGFTDKYSWIPQFYAGWGEGTIFDDTYRRKPAYDALNRTLANG
jgi:endo-1,4-beta-xylanase